MAETTVQGESGLIGGRCPEAGLYRERKGSIMGILTKAPRGTQDILPGETKKWQYVEQVMRETAALYGIREIRFPTFEHTELFQRSVGDTTDVVQKEMYTFEDKGKRSITLRPEGTAGVARTVVEHGMLSGTLPLKLFYNSLSCFRYEKPQAGRLREFHQFGVEMIGSSSPSIDAEAIQLADSIFKELGISGLTLEINSIGCPACREKYYQALREYFTARQDQLCETCKDRLEKNPMRILDCKNPECQELAKDAPVVLDYLCGECREHFDGLKKRLDQIGLSYTVNPRIVRGLDYYTKTVFEFVSNNIGAQGTVCGGGRYDGLFEAMGAAHVPALGFAMGIERLLMVMEQCGAEFPEEKPCTIYIGSMGEAASIKAAELTAAFRAEGFYAECDTMARSVKAQMKYADKLGACYSCIIGDNELETGAVQVKNMKTGEKAEAAIGNNCKEHPELLQFIYDDVLKTALEDVENAIEPESLA